MSLHEPTIPDLQQALEVVQERERHYIATIEDQCAKLCEASETIHRLETELATLRARGA